MAITINISAQIHILSMEFGALYSGIENSRNSKVEISFKHWSFHFMTIHGVSFFLVDDFGKIIVKFELKCLLLMKPGRILEGV